VDETGWASCRDGFAGVGGLAGGRGGLGGESRGGAEATLRGGFATDGAEGPAGPDGRGRGGDHVDPEPDGALTGPEPETERAGTEAALDRPKLPLDAELARAEPPDEE
jgi:hypothetical protein